MIERGAGTAHLEQRIAVLEEWRRDAVNGNLIRLQERMEGLKEDVAKLGKSSDALRMWLIGVLTSVILSSMGMVVTLLILLLNHRI